MKSLFLDTSANYINVYLIENNEVVYSESLTVLKDMSNKIVPLIRKSFESVSFSINDLDKIFVTIGPGSFTGVRIGLTFAKTVAWGLNIPIYPISTLEFLASVHTNKKRVISIIDARRGNVFAGYYDCNLNKLDSEHLIPFSSIDILDDDLLVSYAGIYDSYKFAIDIIKLINKHKDDLPVNPHDLVPNYLKKTEAEEKLHD